ncbi:MAG: P-protein [Firmicutes bacterium ADurb.Bin080]|jgi:chorismate mutase / prephenate dehydratase|nr:chorismate mutase [Clostridiales bacterium]OQC14080.1 MAG: P-protein [Firmicutes bacterium ADurb.Bin080]
MELDEIRKKIDEIDDNMVSLYEKRMILAKEVALFKKKTGSPLENPQREKEIINRVTESLEDEIKLYAKQFFETLFETSKAYQSGYLELKSDLLTEIKEKITKGILKFPVNANVACQGAEGSYSNMAADKVFPINNIMYFKDFEGVFGAIEKKFCQFGILPIENSSVGSINEVYDLMRKHRFYIVRSIKLHVKHNLLAKRGVEIKDIKEIFSHEQAIAQSAIFLKSLKDVKVTVVSNTAVAAKIVRDSERRDIACISSKECAELYGLSVVKQYIQDKDNNYTRFIVIAPELQIYEKSEKISIFVHLPHRAGSLNKMLNKFATLGLNLTKLESRPIPDSVFEFGFYFDFDAEIENMVVQNLLAELDLNTEQFVFLGCYREVD